MAIHDEKGVKLANAYAAAAADIERYTKDKRRAEDQMEQATIRMAEAHRELVTHLTADDATRRIFMVTGGEKVVVALRDTAGVSLTVEDVYLTSDQRRSFI